MTDTITAFPAIEELQQFDQWVVWKLETREKEPTKVPYRADGKGKASATNRTTWATYQAVFDVYQSYNGIGFVLTLDDPFIFIDLDHCRNPETGVIDEWAWVIIKRLNSYTEISQSGAGVHIFVKAELPPGGNRKGQIELYYTGRFAAMTFNHLEGTPDTIEERQEAINQLHAGLFPVEPKIEGNGHNPTLTNLSDFEVIAKASNASNGASFIALLNGDTSGHGGDDSAADLAFCCHLAFWTGCNQTQMDRIFRGSKLYREKWERQDYREATLTKACDNTTDTYCVNKNTYIINAAVLHETVSKADKSGTTSGQLRDKNWGSLSEKFDQLMREARAPADKRDIAETLGVRASDDSFRKLLSRRKESGQVRAYRGSPYVIEWVNRDYRVTNLTDTTGQAMLSVGLALELETQIKVPQGTVGVIAGTTSGGKTSFQLATAEKCVLIQSRPVYFWYNEMSEAKLRTRIDDFPALIEAQKQGRFSPVKQADFEFGDVQHPEAINIIDYIDRDDNMYLIAQDIKAVHQPLTTGAVFLAIQKKKDQETGFGGVMTMKLANLYVSLDIVEQGEHSMRGRATIRKAKDWAGDYNPVGLSCAYHTGGKHGKLIKDGEWVRLER